MRQISTTVELNDIGRITSAPTCRLHANFNRPNSAPLDTVLPILEQFESFQNNDSGRKYLSRSSDDNNDPPLLRRATTSGENVRNLPENYLNLNMNKSIVKNNVSLSPVANQTRSISSVINPVIQPTQTAENQTSYKYFFANKIRLSHTVKKILFGSSLIVIVSFTGTGATQLAKLTLSESNFYAPYFLAWFYTNWMMLCYPLYSGLMAIFKCLKIETPKMSKNLMREAKSFYGPNGPTKMNVVLMKNLLFMSLWVITNYAYCQALGYLTAAETNSLFVSHPAFIYLVSWIYFHDAFVPIRIISVLLSIVGVVLMAHATGIGTNSFIGVVSAVISSSTAAIFKILFKSMFGDPMLNQMPLFFTLLGFSNLIFNWPLTFILYITNAEKLVWTNIPWKYICASSALFLIWQFSSNLGTSSQYSVFISTGLFFSVPLNAVVDFARTGTIMGTFQIMSSVCIFLSCSLLLLPADFTSRLPGHLMKNDV